MKYFSKTVTVRDEQGLGEDLLKDGFKPSRIDEAKKFIQDLFKKSAIRVFANVLGRRVPTFLYVDFVLKTDKRSFLACFDTMRSREDSLYIQVNKPFVISVMNTGKSQYVKRTVYHELIHAADLEMLTQNKKIFSLNHLNYQKDISKEHDDAWNALLVTIRFFEHFRNEGAAILGEHLLTKTPFGKVSDTIRRFHLVYGHTLLKSQKWSQNEKEFDEVYNDTVYHDTYKIAPTIMVLVLEKREDIGKELALMVMEGLESGNYNLSDEEISSIIKAALSLSLSDYIQGVTNLGGKIAPVKPFLEFCDAVQSKIKEEDTITTEDKKAFTKLFRQLKTANIYRKVMEQIVESILPEAKIDDLFQKFDEKPDDFFFHHKLKEKVEMLYSILKNDADPEKKKIAQLALTYLFNQKDFIHDDLEGIGLVDDVTVIDYALKILNEKL